MPILNLRNVPESVHRNLRIRSARNGRSMEAEARAILQDACSGRPGPRSAVELQDWVSGLYGGHVPQGVTDDLIAERRREAASE